MSNKESKNVSLTVRFPPDIHAAVEHIANIETRSVNQQVLHFVKQSLDAVLNSYEIENEENNE